MHCRWKDVGIIMGWSYEVIDAGWIEGDILGQGWRGEGVKTAGYI